MNIDFVVLPVTAVALLIVYRYTMYRHYIYTTIVVLKDGWTKITYKMNSLEAALKEAKASTLKLYTATASLASVNPGKLVAGYSAVKKEESGEEKEIAFGVQVIKDL